MRKKGVDSAKKKNKRGNKENSWRERENKLTLFVFNFKL